MNGTPTTWQVVLDEANEAPGAVDSAGPMSHSRALPRARLRARGSLGLFQVWPRW